MSFCTSTPSFATTATATAAQAFHVTTSSTKRGCDAIVTEDDTSYFQHDRSHKRIKFSSHEPTGFSFSAPSCSYQPRQPLFQAPIPFTSPSGGSPCFTYGGEFAQTKKRGRST